MKKPEKQEEKKTDLDHVGIDLRVEDLIVWVEAGRGFRVATPKRAILKGVNAEFRRGTMTAVVGPSGSGKTTLVNFLAGRQDASQNFRNHCTYFVNGARVESVSAFKNLVGYVLQDNVLEARSTPRQILRYYARLRGYADPAAEAERVLGAMGLLRCADTVVGDAFHRGLSGGEQKRTSIAVELVARPTLLFMDEPTTGLDSTTALDVLMNVAELRQHDLTIVCTVHQPSEEILALFDRVLVLVDGLLVFDDAPAALQPRLAALGHLKHFYETPIEHFMKVVDKDQVRVALLDRGLPLDESRVAAVHAQRIAALSAAQDTASRLHLAPSDPVHPTDPVHPAHTASIQQLQALAASRNLKVNPLSQFAIIFHNEQRLFFTHFRGIVLKMVMYWLVFIMIIIVFIKTPSVEDDPSINIQNMGGLLYMILMFFFMAGASGAATTVLPMKAVFKKDVQSRLYNSAVFFISSWANIVPFSVFNVTVVGITEFFIFKINFSPQSNLLWFWALIILINQAGMSIGLLLASIADRWDDLGALLPVVALPMVIVSGFFANILTITWPLRLYSYLAPPRFIFQGLIQNHFRDRQAYLAHCRITVPCLFNQALDCVYHPPLGSQLANQCDPGIRFNFEQNGVGLNFGIAVVLWLGWLLFAMCIFLIRYREAKTLYFFDQEFVDLYAGRLREDKAQLELARFELGKDTRGDTSPERPGVLDQTLLKTVQTQKSESTTSKKN